MIRFTITLIFVVLAGYRGGHEFSRPVHELPQPKSGAYVDLVYGGLSVISMEQDIIVGNSLPRFGEICGKAVVHGNPREDSIILYVIYDGEKVRLREQAHGKDRSWVMIAPAEWIKLTSLCGFK